MPYKVTGCHWYNFQALIFPLLLLLMLTLITNYMFILQLMQVHVQMTYNHTGSDVYVTELKRRLIGS